MRTQPTNRPTEPFLRVARVATGAEVLGPGSRTVVWVQGCALRCRGCMSPEWLPLDGGRAVDPALLATRLAGLVGDGLTVSGGEPFLQAEALCILLDGLRRHLPGLSTMAYSGYRHEWLRDRGTEDQRELLRRLDILVDGPYVERRHAPLRWRGSTNQRIIWLSDRHRTLREESDTNAGLQVEVLSDGAFRFLGVPPTPGFRAGLVAGLARDGLRVETEPPA